MEKKKGNELQIFLLMLVLVILMVIVSVNYLYLPLVEEKQQLQEENYVLNVRLIELTNMSVNENFYKDEINKSRASMSEVLDRYSAGNTPEKSIKLVSDMEETLKMKIPTVTFSSPNVLTSVKMPVVRDAEDGSYSIGYYDVTLLQETLSANYSCDYNQLKSLVDYVNAYPERMNIESIAVNYDSETDLLGGNIVFNLYAVTGTDKQYTEPEISNIRLGEDNIFSK
ncbi:MAG: hypothetical protein PUC73_12295 [Lachnospiraceae bacterium]|nr:hypothetical protein [Lachnospiraceae bacterium]